MNLIPLKFSEIPYKNCIQKVHQSVKSLISNIEIDYSIRNNGKHPFLSLKITNSSGKDLYKDTFVLMINNNHLGIYADNTNKHVVDILNNQSQIIDFPIHFNHSKKIQGVIDCPIKLQVAFRNQ